ncbi:MAG: hypothetical protein DYG94_09650 [Leptolyngbya sp. PLA3]|nr:MAG: hypothetical protein EDM82_08045 [Cyanobacteria bacterium CYA]MCE7968993.1 hypothetical protein [Leptolyngbya sp. PL-A3]
MTRVAMVLLVFLAGQVVGSDALPIREVTVFKDGHAMVLRSGVMPTNDAGDVTLSELPQPILGTFWAFERQDGAALRSVKAGSVEEPTEVEPGNLQHLLLLSTDEHMTLTLQDASTVTGTLVKVIGGINGTALVQSDTLVAIPMADIRRVHFSDASAAQAREQATVQRNRLTIDLGWERTPGTQADVGMMYIQKGLRWIPSYRVTILDEDTARVELQATLVNELADLQDVSAHLVVGVPAFAFAHTIDPIALQQQVAQLGPYFDRADQTGYAMSNAIMAQTARMAEAGGGRYAGDEIAPPPDVEVGGTESKEDLYVFHVDHLTLAKGERLVVPIATAEVPFEPIYTLTLPVAPPTEAWQYFNTDQQRQIASMLSKPAATHVLRMTNSTEHPFTTAPALIIRDGRPLAQGMMTYTAKTSKVDLEVTKAVDIRVETTQKESTRNHDGLEWNDHTYARLNLEGTAEVTNYKDRRVKLEVTKYVLGIGDGASHDGDVEQVDFYTDLDWSSPDFQWYRWYGWPWWWSRLNGAARITWELDLDPGEHVDLTWQWHYFWG